MPDFLRASRDKNRRLAEFVYHLFDLASYEFVYLFSPSRKDMFFNSGFLPLDPELRVLPGMEPEAHAAMMYHFVLARHLQGLIGDPRRILDVGCGQGGGLLYASALYPRAELSGTERSLAARRLARRRLAGLPAARVVSSRLPPAGPFDLILGVGTPTYFGLTAFVETWAPRLAADGALSVSGGYRRGDHAVIREELSRAASHTSLRLARYTDITPHTFAALKADIPRREAALARLPRPFRSYGRRWADLPGSPEYEEYRTNQRADFAAVLLRA